MSDAVKLAIGAALFCISLAENVLAFLHDEPWLAILGGLATILAAILLVREWRS